MITCIIQSANHFCVVAALYITFESRTDLFQSLLELVEVKLFLLFKVVLLHDSGPWWTMFEYSNFNKKSINTEVNLMSFLIFMVMVWSCENHQSINHC